LRYIKIDFLYRDGVATTFEDAITLFDETTAPSIITDGAFLWIVGNRGISTTGTPVYVFSAGTLQKPFLLPIQRTINSGLAIYRGGVLISSGEGSGTATYEDGVAGLWMVGRHTSQDAFFATIFADFHETTVNITPNAIFSSGQTVYAGINDTTGATSYEIHTLDGTNTAVSEIWSSLPMDAGDAGNTKVWKTVKVELEQDETLWSSVVVSYRTDYADSFTTLKTYSSQDASKKVIPIRRSGKVIEIRVELTSSTGVRSARLHSITLDYSPTQR